MKLKQLTLRGFKSFADRTRLDFSSGVNVVVGPNGSGKSNILDAIAWVMGTQATRSLRTEKMEDVVFAGTETRPALSRAEVALTFANDDQIMALDLAEITITRRLFRDGTSEYELNGAPCRLLDIQDLLSDGGIGRQQHVLVGQGQIGDILNARPEDHRSVIEEAAGVTKHRSRRDRAVRRLERTDHDVERLTDILAQQMRALRPLKRQANAAARYDSVKSESVAIALWLGGEQLRTLRSRLSAASDERKNASDALETSEVELSELRGSLETLRAAAGQVRSELNRDTTAAARLETVRERLKSITAVARERSRSISSRREGADERIEDLDLEASDLRSVLDDAARLERAATEEVERRGAVLRSLEDEERSLAEQIQLPTEGVVATLRGDLRALETAAKRDIDENEQIARRLRVVEDRIDDERREIESLNADIQTADSSVTELARAYDAKLEVRESASVAYDDARLALDEARIEVATGKARADALQGALDGLVDEHAVEIATRTQGLLGTVVARLDVPVDYAVAVDAGLGVWSASYVADGTASMRTAVESLKVAGTGGVSIVLPLEQGTILGRTAAARFGVEALVDVLGPNADMPLAEALLGDVVLVEGWSTAWHVAENVPGVVAVTPEGDIVTAHGMIVAQPDGAGPAALEAATVALEEAQRDFARATSIMAGATRTFEIARDEAAVAVEALENLESKLGGLTEALGLVDRALLASLDEAERLAARSSAIVEASESRDERIGMLRDRVAEFEGEEAARQAAWDALNTRRAEVAGRRQDALASLQEASAELAGIEERSRISASRLQVVTADLNQLQLVPDDDGNLDSLESVKRVARSAVETVSMHIDALRVRQRDLRVRVDEADGSLARSEARREQLEGMTRSASSTVNTLDIELAELRVRDEAALEALRRDVDASEQRALAAPKPDLPEDTEPEGRLDTLRADLRRMGPINPLAASEHEALASEVTELEKQLGDLNQSRAELKKVIAALDEKMVDLFEEAFTDIATFYEENFALVFPGGKGRLRLVASDDPLTAGVVVEAQPAGKKVGRLSLLSGGERSLAALAFLFAVFRARPSPFYVLDEVEAALDDANLHRFLRLVDTLSGSVQLVIITHQQQTMEAADVLYGVTLETAGSSKVISKRMSSVTV
ncbi:MAG: chromosome segregation protein SMC [Actinomycetota bacterium]